MMRTAFYALTVMSLSVLFACGSINEKDEVSNRIIDNKNYKYQKKVELVQMGNVEYDIDSESPNYPRCTQIFEDSSGSYYTYLNKLNNNIYFFDKVNRQPKFKVAVPAFNDTEEGKGLDGYYIKNLDSIFICYRYYFGIVDTSGTIKLNVDFFDIQRKNLKNTSIFSINCTSEFVEKDGHIFINNAPDLYAHKKKEFKGDQCLFAFKLNDEKKGSYQLRYPIQYRNGAFGPNFLSYSNCYNSKTGQIVFSFPNDNYIGTYSIETGERKNYYCGSEFLEQTLPMENPSNEFEDYNKFYLFSPSYASIIYDKYRNVYYRFALRPISPNDYEKRRWWKGKSIVILDSNFSKIGESNIPDDCSFLDYYVDETGLLINSSKDETKIDYWRFALKTL